MEAKQFETALKDAETLLRKVRSLYDQWFAGIEKGEPTVQRDELERQLTRMKASPPRNTALRFRLNQLSQQYQTYTTYWKRISRQIEEGTYQRDLLRARRQRDAGTASLGPEARRSGAPDATARSQPRATAGSERAATPGVAESAEAPPRDDTARRSHPALRPARVPGDISPLAFPEADAPTRPRSIIPPGAPVRTRSRPPAPVVSHPPQTGGIGRDGGLPEPQMRALFDRYVEARRQNAERTDNVRLETLAKNVAEMLPKLRAKHPGKKIGFTVVVKDGRVGLKPITK